MASPPRWQAVTSPELIWGPGRGARVHRCPPKPRLATGLSPRDGAAARFALQSARRVALRRFRAAGSTNTCVLLALLEAARRAAGFCRVPLLGTVPGNHSWLVPGATGPCPSLTRRICSSPCRRWLAFYFFFFKAGPRQLVGCVLRFRSASPALPRSLPRVMSLRFTGPRFGFQDHSLQGGDGRAEQMQRRPRLASVPAGVCLSRPVSVPNGVCPAGVCPAGVCPACPWGRGQAPRRAKHFIYKHKR